MPIRAACLVSASRQDSWTRLIMGNYVQTCNIRTLVPVASRTRQCQIIQARRAPVLLCDDVIDVDAHTSKACGSRQYSHSPRARLRTRRSKSLDTDMDLQRTCWAFLST
jgi:hypothetical protein